MICLNPCLAALSEKGESMKIGNLPAVQIHLM